MRVLVICNTYPSEQARYRNGFIHRRVKAYQAADIEVSVFYEHSPVSKPYSYAFDGVNVRVGNEAALEEEVANGSFDAFLVHFAEPSRIEPLERLEVKQPVIVWVHGYEAEAWHRRWFNFLDSSDSLFHALSRKNGYFKKQNTFLRDLMTTSPLNLTFINVSQWFQQYVVEPDVGAEFKDSIVIPNLVDEKLFYKQAKIPQDRKKIL